MTTTPSAPDTTLTTSSLPEQKAACDSSNTDDLFEFSDKQLYRLQRADADWAKTFEQLRSERPEKGQQDVFKFSLYDDVCAQETNPSVNIYWWVKGKDGQPEQRWAWIDAKTLVDMALKQIVLNDNTSTSSKKASDRLDVDVDVD